MRTNHGEDSTGGAAAPKVTPGFPALQALQALLALLALLGLLASSACGNVTSGGAGEIEVLLSSDVVEDVSGSASGAAVSNGVEPGSGAQTEDPLTGSMRVTVRSFVWTGEGELGDGRGDTGWIEITDGPQEVEVALEDPAPVTVARASLPAGEYRGVRTIFGRVRLTVESGLVIDGEPITGEIQVSIGSGGLLVVEERGVAVEEDLSLPVLLEMGVRRWIHLLDPETRSVDEADFEREFRVRTRPAGQASFTRSERRLLPPVSSGATG